MLVCGIRDPATTDRSPVVSCVGDGPTEERVMKKLACMRFSGDAMLTGPVLAAVLLLWLICGAMTADAAGRDASLRGMVPVLRQGQSVKVPQLHGIKAAGSTPGAAGMAREATAVTMKWDTHALEVALDCADDGIVAEQTGRDNMKFWKDGCVYVWLGPRHTHDAAKAIAVQDGRPMGGPA